MVIDNNHLLLLHGSGKDNSKDGHTWLQKRMNDGSIIMVVSLFIYQ